VLGLRFNTHYCKGRKEVGREKKRNNRAFLYNQLSKSGNLG
jgi:hypothetical protein